MNETYDFNWLIGDIDASMIFMLRSGKEMLGSYYVSELKTNGIEEEGIKFANINDLTNFINYTTVRFANSLKNINIIEIPLRNLIVLYERSNEITSEEPNGIELSELEGVNDTHVLKTGYAIYSYKINEPSEELKEVMKLTHTFNNLSMNDKISALEDINLVNYQRLNKNKQK